MPITKEDIQSLMKDAGDEIVKTVEDKNEELKKQVADETKALLDEASKASKANPIHSDGSGIEVSEPEPEYLKDSGTFFNKVYKAATSPTDKVELEKALQVHHKDQNVAVSSEGGFLPTAQIAADIRDKTYEVNQLLKDCDIMPLGGSNDRFIWHESDVDDRSAAGYNGIVAYRAEEATAVTASTATLRERELAVKKMMVYVKASEEVLSDSVALSAYVMKNAPKSMGKKIDNEIMRGTGAGQCLGIINSPALISVAKETSQAADSIVKENIEKMYDNLDPDLLAGAKWYINPHARKELRNLAMAVGTGGAPVYLPEGSMAGQPFGTLLGLPVVPTNACSKLGDLGDLVLANLDEYLIVEKQGIQAAESMHFLFDVAQSAFRWTWRVNGMPKWAAPVTPENANAGEQLSYAVGLATR
jgi:HK97 family phage major capsid protein